MADIFDQSKLKNHYHWIFLSIFVIGLFLRLLNLGKLPLSTFEAESAAQAYSIANSQSPSMGSQAAYINLTALTFFLTNANDFTARLWSALFGSLIILLPYFWRERIGLWQSLLLGICLAFDPLQLAASRMAGSQVFALVGLLLGLTFLFKGQMILAGVLLAIAFLGGESFWFGLILIGLTYLIAKLSRIPLFSQTPSPSPNSHTPATTPHSASFNDTTPTPTTLTPASTVPFPSPNTSFPASNAPSPSSNACSSTPIPPSSSPNALLPDLDAFTSSPNACSSASNACSSTPIPPSPSPNTSSPATTAPLPTPTTSSLSHNDSTPTPTTSFPASTAPLPIPTTSSLSHNDSTPTPNDSTPTPTTLSPSRKSLSLAISFIITLLLLSSSFGLYPAGISGIMSGFVFFLQRFFHPSNILFWQPAFALLAYQFIPIVFAFWASIRGWNQKDNTIKLHSLCLVIGFILLTIFPGRQILDLIWIGPSLYFLCIIQFLRVFYPARKTKLPILLLVLFSLIMLSFIYVNLRSLADPNLNASNSLNHIISVGAGTLLLGLAITLIGLGWGMDLAWKSALLGACIFGILTVSANSLAQINFSNDSSFELWEREQRIPLTNLTKELLTSMSDINFSDQYAAEIDVIKLIDMRLNWILRDFEQVRFSNSLAMNAQPEFVITPLEEMPRLSSTYRGQEFTWIREPNWRSMSLIDHLRWLLNRGSVNNESKIIVWVRSDMFLDQISH